MVLLSRCCCWRSLRKGSFASGIFTLAVYLALLVFSVFRVADFADSTELLAMNALCMLFSLSCVVSSLILFVGLSVDNRLLLLPWVASVSAATGLELAAALYLVADAIEYPWVWILFAIDMLFCLLSVYCILCVVSQYQQYLTGRGYGQPIPTVRFQASESACQGGVSTVSQQVARRHNGLLAPPTPSTSKSTHNTDTSSVSADSATT